MPTEEKAKPNSSRSSSAASTPSKSPEKNYLPPLSSPAVHRIIDVPLFPDSTAYHASRKEKKMTSSTTVFLKTIRFLLKLMSDINYFYLQTFCFCLYCYLMNFDLELVAES